MGQVITQVWDALHDMPSFIKSFVRQRFVAPPIVASKQGVMNHAPTWEHAGIGAISDAGIPAKRSGTRAPNPHRGNRRGAIHCARKRFAESQEGVMNHAPTPNTHTLARFIRHAVS